MCVFCCHFIAAFQRYGTLSHNPNETLVHCDNCCDLLALCFNIPTKFLPDPVVPHPQTSYSSFAIFSNPFLTVLIIPSFLKYVRENREKDKPEADSGRP